MIEGWIRRIIEGSAEVMFRAIMVICREADMRAAELHHAIMAVYGEDER